MLQNTDGQSKNDKYKGKYKSNAFKYKLNAWQNKYKVLIGDFVVPIFSSNF